jgi:hypothetical protein
LKLEVRREKRKNEEEKKRGAAGKGNEQVEDKFAVTSELWFSV